MPRTQPPQGNTAAVTNTPLSSHEDQNSDMQDSSHYPAHEDHHHHGNKESGVNNTVRSTTKRRSSSSSSKGPVVLLIDKPLRKLMAEEFSLKRQSSHGKLYLDLDDKLAATYDYDTNEDAEDDDASDAGSEFTEDYSRHNQRRTMLPSYDAEEESSLSSIGSFGEEQEESWSDYGGEGGSQSSSTVDSRQQLRKMKTHQLHNDYRVDGIHGTLSTQFDGHLLEDSTEFSVEEDPLFNASGTIRMYNPPPPVPVVATSSAAEVWTDEEDFHDSWVPPPPNDQIWRETTDGQWVPNSNNDHAGVQSPQLDRWSSTSSVGPDQIPSSPHAANRRFQRQPSARSILTTNSSFESFAGDGTPPSQRRKRRTSRRASRQSSTASSPNTNNSRKGDGRPPPPPPPPPLRQDSKMHIDDSDDDDIIKEVLIFSDEEDDITSNTLEDSKPFAIPATILENSLATMPGTSEDEAVATATAATTTTAITITLMASADSLLKERSRSKSPNPIVPSPRLAKRKTVNVDVVVANSAKMELPTHQKRQANNTSPVKGFRSTENVRCFISPNDRVGPLKDHSKRTRPKKSKSSSSSRSLCGKSNKKKKKKSKSRSSKNTTTVVMGEEDYQMDTESTMITDDSIHYDPTISLQAARDMAAAHPFDSDDNCSVASNCSASSDCSNDTMDATGVTRSKRRKSSSKSSKDKKAAKKKRKKERPRKRGRRADYEEDSTDDDDPAQESSKPGAVADRVEAIFTNKQMIFESNLHQRATTVEEKKEHSKLVAAAAAAAEEEPTSHAIAEKEATTETVAEMMEPEATKASPTLSLTAKNTILDAVEGELETFLSSISNFNAADISFRHGEDTDDKPTTFRLKSKAAEEWEASKSSSKRGGRSLRRSKSSIDPPDSTSRGKSKTRSRSVSKESASRSHRRSRSKSKDAGRSSKSENSNNKERNQSKSPSRSKSRKSVRRSKSSNVTNTKKDEEDKSSVKEKKKTLKSPTSPKLMKGKVAMPPISSNNAMTLQDVIGRGAETSEDDDSIDPRLASPTSLHQKSLLVASQQSLDLGGSMILSLASVSTHDDINGNEIPVGNINLVRIKIKRMQGKIEEIQLQTKDKLKHLQQEFDRKKSFLEGKVRAEEKNSNAMEAIMYLHKITVKDLHQQGRKMKKTMKHFQKGISYEIAKSVELTRQSQELQRQTTAKVMEIRQLERENAHHSRNLQRCQTEHQELLFECRADFHTHSGTLVGSVEDYATETLIPLYQKWRLPKSIEKTKIEVLAKSYILPKSSIFYNV